MTRSATIKIRVTPKTKADLFVIAETQATTVSALMRELVSEAAIGRSISPGVRRDMAAVRSVANNILACAESGGSNDVVSRRLTEAARRLREVAARHLGPAP